MRFLFSFFYLIFKNNYPINKLFGRRWEFQKNNGSSLEKQVQTKLMAALKTKRKEGKKKGSRKNEKKWHYLFKRGSELNMLAGVRAGNTKQ